MAGQSVGTAAVNAAGSAKTGYNRFLLIVAGLGGLLYGVDVGIISGALPYLEATSGLNAGQLSIIVAAVLLGSVISTLFAGMLADWMGRKLLMGLSGLLFVASIPMIALAHGYGPLVAGRLLQGISAGLIGVVIPLYLAECLSAKDRGKGTGIFQWLLTLGIVAAAVIAIFFSMWLDKVQALGDAAKLFAAKDMAWRSIFWVSLPPGLLFVIGSFVVAESPRWLFRRGNKDGARTALLRSRSDEQAEIELKEMEENMATEKNATSSTGRKVRESLLKRKYVIPFVLACVVLACTQATGVNSIIGYNATILIQAGLSDVAAHWGYLILTSVNFLITMIGVALVDKKGRKFLLSLGTAGIIVSLIVTASLFKGVEKQGVDCKTAIQQQVAADQTLSLAFNRDAAAKLLESQGEAGRAIIGKPTSMTIIYSYGDYTTATAVMRSEDLSAKPVEINRAGCLPSNKVISFFSHGTADLEAAKTAPLKIEKALVTPIPSSKRGWIVALFLFLAMASFAVGPGVCVWLALSELMPTRIRSNGMSIALLINQTVSTTIAAIFLPAVAKVGYSTMFFFFAGCTVIYFITAAFFLPETKGKTLEEIEEHFSGKKS